MDRKDKSSVASRAQDTTHRGLSLSDKYILLQGETQKLRRQIGRLCKALRDWRERDLFFQAERDHCRRRNGE
jgi:hypothetical protein